MNQANLVNGPAYLRYGSARVGAPVVGATGQTDLSLYCEGDVEVKPMEPKQEHRAAGAGVVAKLRTDMTVEITAQPVSTWAAVKMILAQLNRRHGALVCATGTPGSPDNINIPLKVTDLTGVGQENHRTALTGLPGLAFGGGNVVLQGGCTWTAMTKNAAAITEAGAVLTATTGETFTLSDSVLAPWSPPMRLELREYGASGTPDYEVTTLSNIVITPQYTLEAVRSPDAGTVNWRVTQAPSALVTLDGPDMSATTLHGLLHRTGSGTGIGTQPARWDLKLVAQNGTGETITFPNVFLDEGTRIFGAAAPWRGLSFSCHQTPAGVLATFDDSSS